MKQSVLQRTPSSRWRAAFALSSALALAALLVPSVETPARAATGDYVLHAGRVITADGKVFEKGGSVLVSGGRIEDVREGYVNPWGAEVREYKKHWLLPGFVEAHSQGGLEAANERAPNTPFVSVLDGVDPLSSYFEDLLREGVTTVLVIPGDQTLLGGQGLVLDPVGRTVEEMIVARDGGLKVALTPRRGTSRMAQFAELRRTFEATRVSEGSRALRDPDSDERDPRSKSVGRLLAGELRAVFACGEPVDVANALKLQKNYKLRGLFMLGSDCARAIPLIVKNKLSVVLPTDLEPLERDPETGKERRRQLAREFDAAGIPLILHANERSSYGERSLWYQAARAVAQGVDRKKALAAITANPAKALGVDKRVGKVAKGLDANLVLWTGDPLSGTAWVDHVFVEGEHVYERSKDRKLARLIRGAGDNEEDR